MKATNLTEMDPQYAGGGSDPYINFVPLTEHLYTHRHMKRVGKATGKAYFNRLPKTRMIRHELNPVWDGDVVEIEINVKDEVRKRGLGSESRGAKVEAVQEEQRGAKDEGWCEERGDELTRTRALGITTYIGDSLRSSLSLSLSRRCRFLVAVANTVVTHRWS